MRTFDEIMEKCTRPSTEIMRLALDLRDRVASHEADYLTYLAAYTHFAESQSIIGEYGHFLDEHERFFVDHRTGKFLAKLLMLDMKDHSLGWRAQRLAKQQGDLWFVNETEGRNQTGEFLGKEWLPTGLTFWEYQEYVATLELGLYEEVTQRTRSFGLGCDKSLVCHIADTPANYDVSLSRMFSNVSAVVLAPNREEGMNVAFWRLEEAPEAVHENMRRARWFILETSAEDLAMKLLDRLGATYTVFGKESRGPEVIDLIADQLAEELAAVQATASRSHI